MLLLRNGVLNGSLLEAHNNGIISMPSKKPVSLALLSTDFQRDQKCELWAAIQSSVHTDPDEQKAVARSIVKDNLSAYAKQYANAYYQEVCELYSIRPFAPYAIGYFRSMPTFVNRASKKQEKLVLGWAYSFLTEAGEENLLSAFEGSIADSLSEYK